MPIFQTVPPQLTIRDKHATGLLNTHAFVSTESFEEALKSRSAEDQEDFFSLFFFSLGIYTEKDMRTYAQKTKRNSRIFIDPLKNEVLSDQGLALLSYRTAIKDNNDAQPIVLYENYFKKFLKMLLECEGDFGIPILYRRSANGHRTALWIEKNDKLRVIVLDSSFDLDYVKATLALYIEDVITEFNQKIQVEIFFQKTNNSATGRPFIRISDSYQCGTIAFKDLQFLMRDSKKIEDSIDSLTMLSDQVSVGEYDLPVEAEKVIARHLRMQSKGYRSQDDGVYRNRKGLTLQEIWEKHESTSRETDYTSHFSQKQVKMVRKLLTNILDHNPKKYKKIILACISQYDALCLTPELITERYGAKAPAPHLIESRISFPKPILGAAELKDTAEKSEQSDDQKKIKPKRSSKS